MDIFNYFTHIQDEINSIPTNAPSQRIFQITRKRMVGLVHVIASDFNPKLMRMLL